MVQQIRDEESIFLKAIEITSAEQRAAYIESACGDDQRLRAQLETLLQEHEKPQALLDVTEPYATVELSANEKAGSTIGPYRLLEQIGEGGFGVVYMAEQKEPVKRHVALKIIKPGMDSQQVIARFETERQALAMMDHPHIAKVLDAGATDSGRPYFVMELVKGTPITEFCDVQKLSTHQRLRLFGDVCRAVQHAHQKGIIHRDLKPSNVLISVHDNKPVVKVIDFGVAKALGAELTEKTVFTACGQMVGTPLYMSPEQAQLSGLDVDPRSDVYSLGVLLYELLTGTTPFEQETLKQAGFDEMRRIIREVEPPRPSARISALQGEALSTVSACRRNDPKRLRHSLRGELDWIVMKALEKSHHRRYETVSAFAADVERYLANDPIKACPPSVLYRLRKFGRRNLGSLATATLILCALVMGTAVAAWQAIRATGERDRAIIAETKARNAEAQANKESKLAREAEKAAKREELAARRHLHTARIHLAEQEMQRNRWGTALKLLEAQRAAPIQEDLRGFAWRHLSWRTQEKLLAELDGHNTWVFSLTYSPDGKLLASGCLDGIVKLWDTTTQKAIRTFEGHTDSVRSVAVSPDGKLLASAGDDGNVILWNIASGHEQRRLKKQPKPVRAVAFSPDGELLATQDTMGTLGLWNPETCELRKTLADKAWNEEGNFPFLAFSPDGRTLAAKGRQETIELWDLTEGEVRRRMNRHLGFHGVAYSPDGGTLVSVGSKRQIVFWDTKTGEPIAEWVTEIGVPRSVAFSSHGNAVAIGFGEGTVMRLDLESAKKEYYAHIGSVQSVAFSPVDNVLTSAGYDGSVKSWGYDRKTETTSAKGGDPLVWALAFSPDGKTFAAAAPNDMIRLRDVATGSVLTELKGKGIGLAFSPSGAFLACAGSGNTIRVWNRHGNDSLRRLAHSQSTGATTYAVAFSPDGCILASGAKDGTIVLWDTANWERLATIQAGDAWVWSLDFSPDGRWLASGGDEGSEYSVAVWDWRERKLHAVVQEANGPAIFSPDGHFLACQSTEQFGRIKLWNAQTGTTRMMARKTSQIFFQRDRIAFFPDGKTLASVAGGNVTFWDVASGRERPMLRELRHWAFSVAVSPHGNTLATGGSDGSVHLWRTTKSPRPPSPASEDAKPSPGNPPDGGTPQVLRLAARLAARELVNKPRSVELYERRAEAYARLGEAEKAATDWTTILGLLPARDYAHRIKVLDRLGRYEEAAAEVVKAIDARPKSGWIHRLPAFSQLMDCDERVLDHFDRKQPVGQRVLLGVGRYLALCGRWERSGEYYAKAQTLDDLRPCGRAFGHACVLVLSGQEDEYVRYCRMIADRFGQTTGKRELYELGRICSLSPRAEVESSRIVQWAEGAMKKRGRSKFTLLVLAAAYYRAGKFDPAIACLEESLAEHGEHRSNVAHLLALAHHRLGHEEEGWIWYELGWDFQKPELSMRRHDPVPWNLYHWLNANVWHREAKAVFEPGVAPTRRSSEARRD